MDLNITKNMEIIYCVCGCGKTRSKYDKYGKERKFIKGHEMIGRKLSQETKDKMSSKRQGKDNPFYGHKLSEENRRKLLESWKGRKHSEETRKKMSKSSKGKNSNEKHYLWKGDNVGYHALHLWVRSRLPKPQYCQICHKISSCYDLSNITGIYNREFKNWKYLCKSCHVRYDKIYERNLKPYIELKSKT